MRHPANGTESRFTKFQTHGQLRGKPVIPERTNFHALDFKTAFADQVPERLCIPGIKVMVRFRRIERAVPPLLLEGHEEKQFASRFNQAA